MASPKTRQELAKRWEALTETSKALLGERLTARCEESGRVIARLAGDEEYFGEIVASGDVDDARSDGVPIIVHSPPKEGLMTPPKETSFDSAAIRTSFDSAAETAPLPPYTAPLRPMSPCEPKSWRPPGVGGTVTVGTSSAATHAAWAAKEDNTSLQRRLEYAAMTPLPPSPKRKLFVRHQRQDELHCDRRADEYAVYAKTLSRREAVNPRRVLPPLENEDRDATPRAWRAVNRICLKRTRCRYLSADLRKCTALEIAVDDSDDVVSVCGAAMAKLCTKDKLVALAIGRDAEGRHVDPVACLRHGIVWNDKFQTNLRCLSLVRLSLDDGTSKDPLQRLSSALQDLTNLRTLDLSFNNLRRAPQHLPRSLRDLLLHNNRLKNTTYLEHLGNLESLDVTHNCFTTIASFHPLVLARRTLVEVRVQGNALTKQPAWRQALRNLLPRAAIL